MINDERYDFVPGENKKLSFRGPHQINRGTSGFTLITSPIRVKVRSFAQTFGGAFFVSVAQLVFLDNISKALKTLAPNLSPKSVLDGVSAGSSPELQAVYGLAIKDALRVGLILAAVSTLGAMLYDWKSLKTKRGDENHERGDEQKRENVEGVQTEMKEK
ncbi:hypothetical protein N7486_011362 [Penicillium sp. IBT 16267x]|nr:hypothetical protein N7486_011362 [Penicillium sp. IBT 16267x]